MYPIDPELLIVAGDGDRLENESVEAVGNAEDAGQNFFKLIILPQNLLIDIVFLAFELPSVICDIPRMHRFQSEMIPDLLKIGCSFLQSGFSESPRLLDNRFRARSHLIAERILGMVPISDDFRPFLPQLQDLEDQWAIIGLPGCGKIIAG